MEFLRAIGPVYNFLLLAGALDADVVVIFADFQRAQPIVVHDLGQLANLFDVHTHLRRAMTALCPPKPRETDSAASACTSTAALGT